MPDARASSQRPDELIRLPTTESKKHARGFSANIRKFWRRNVAIAVPHWACRDHLALERTFLGYTRLGLMLCFAAIFMAQLFPLDSATTRSSFFSVGHEFNTRESDRPSIRTTSGLFKRAEKVSNDSSQGVSYADLAKPMTAYFLASAIVVAMLGAYRFWRQQNAMLRGKIMTAGWETWAAGLVVGVAQTVLLVVVIIGE